MKQVIIIGGGLAGLSAAVELSSAGFRVTLIEQRRFLGGRACSFPDKNSGLELDNGQHILMGCYQDTFRFLAKIGASDKISIQKNLSVDFLDRDARAYRLRCLPLPAPLHILSGIMRFGAIGISDRIRMLRMAKGVLSGGKTDAAHDLTITEWLKKHGQRERSRETLWDVITLATMNESPDKSSAAIFRTVLKKAFFENRLSSRIALPAVPLSRMFADSAEAFIRKNNGVIEKGVTATSILVKNNSVSGIELKDGRTITGNYVISAVPCYSVQRLLAGTKLSGSELNSAPALRSSPIISIHLLFNKPLMKHAFAALLYSPVQWVFNKEMIHGDSAYRGLLSLVISGAHQYVELPSEKLVEMAMRELRNVFPDSMSARIISSRVIKERHATFSPEPGVNKFRPSHKTSIDNFFLAGDWTDTGLPATIEGAVLSGYRCANAIAGI